MALLVAFYWRSSKNSPLQNKSLISASNKKHQLCNTLNTWLIMLVHAINWFCSRYTVIHGQCLTVGVGGYLLGGGVNALGSSARHGFAAKNIIQMKVKWIGFHNKQYFLLYFTLLTQKCPICSFCHDSNQRSTNFYFLGKPWIIKWVVDCAVDELINFEFFKGCFSWRKQSDSDGK